MMVIIHTNLFKFFAFPIAMFVIAKVKKPNAIPNEMA